MSTTRAYKAEIAIDTLEFIWGVAIVSFTIYFAVTYNHLLVLVHVDTLYISIGVGAILMFVGCLGCYSAGDSRRGKRRTLFCNIFLVACCLVAQIVSTVYFRDAVNIVVRQNGVLSVDLVGEDQIYYNNAILSTYVACCDGCRPQETCNNADAYFNGEINPYCNGTCASAQFCDNATNVLDGCFMGSTAKFPPVKIDRALCAFFRTAKPADSTLDNTLVGPVGEGSCGGGLPDVYTSEVLEYLAWYYNLALTALMVLCVFQALSLSAALCLCQHVSGGRFAAPPPPKSTQTRFVATNAF